MDLVPGLRTFLCAVTALAAAALGGCKLIDDTSKLPLKAVHSVLPTGSTAVVDPAQLQLELQRYADDFTSRTVASLDEYSRSVGSAEVRSEALRLKLAVATSAYSIASGPNPTAGLLDFLAMAIITRAALEERLAGPPRDEAFQPWLETSRALEMEAWKMAEGVLTPLQLDELRQAIERWREANPGARVAFFARPQGFFSAIHQSAGQQTERGIFSLIGLDPTAGLDPAVREATRFRLFAERAMFMMQRMHYVLRAQVEVLADRLLNEDQVSKALASTTRLAESADRASRAVESASRTFDLLPDRIASERQAILEALEEQSGRLRELSAQFEGALVAGEKMSTSLNATLITFDALMKRFGVGEPKPDAPPRAPGAKPFDVLDYARTADQVAHAARELDVLLKQAESTMGSPELDRRLAALEETAQRASAGARSVLNHAFLLGAGLVLFTFACLVACRRLAPRRAQPGSDREPDER